ncbi:O-antigen ligase family protein [uncultured Algoriphagus sp.]|uniref:O-antigen ligase family protein n=1 Tax=uncultured Algoriphagus sp. TaxID=417365 RepID=UPI0025985A76|nr:O-antigen ligase family protein [uncultured Algoriphagus sp.]
MISWLLSSTKSKKRQQLFFHILLGWLSLYSPLPFILWFYLTLLAFTKKIFSSSGEKAVFWILTLLLYTSAFELLGRMSRASPIVPYELGKYITFLFTIIGIIKARRINPIGLWLVLFLIPGILVGLPYYTSYKDISFNVLGTINLGLGLAMLGYLRLNTNQLLKLLRLMILPMISILAYSIIRTPDLSSFDFDYQANEIVGGFGSNQVSTVYGLAVLLLFILYINQFRFSGFGKNMDLGLLGLFILFGLFTFSRGGMIGATLGILLTLFYQFKLGRKKIRINVTKALILSIPIIVLSLFIANSLTDGKLLLRYKGETYGTLYGHKKKDLNHLTTGRFLLLSEDLEVFSENPILGVGVKQAMSARDKTKGIRTHVELGRLLSEHGLFGVLVICIIFILLFRSYRKSLDNLFFSYLFVLYIIGFYTTFHAATRTFVSPLLMSMCVINYLKNKHESLTDYNKLAQQH